MLEQKNINKQQNSLKKKKVWPKYVSLSLAIVASATSAFYLKNTNSDTTKISQSEKETQILKRSVQSNDQIISVSAKKPLLRNYQTIAIKKQVQSDLSRYSNNPPTDDPDAKPIKIYTKN
jgi:hypothetical protein